MVKGYVRGGECVTSVVFLEYLQKKNPFLKFFVFTIAWEYHDDPNGNERLMHEVYGTSIIFLCFSIFLVASGSSIHQTSENQWHF